MQKAPPTPKGFRDILPDLAIKRRNILNQIVNILESEGFLPIETPTIEFAQTLKGKYGEDEKLIYQFKDRGGRDLALRYDLTVPLARYVATYKHKLKMPFLRYQIGQVFRGENPQKGRYREFTQIDFDIIGSTNLTTDAKVVGCILKIVKLLKIKTAHLFINDRRNFNNIPQDFIRTIDKIHKIGKEKVILELKDKGFKETEIVKLLNKIENTKPAPEMTELFKIIEKEYKFKENQDFSFDPTLARGLDYYTSYIFELKPDKNPASLTIAAGGRYDNLIGMFSKESIPAVGFSIGLDRLTEVIYENLNTYD